ncbi:hypothetical protein V2J09_012052 [Rumex salicifolius]
MTFRLLRRPPVRFLPLWEHLLRSILVSNQYSTIFPLKLSSEELLTYVGEFISKIFDAEFDSLEKALQKFDDGSFFLGKFSLEMNKIEAYKET